MFIGGFLHHPNIDAVLYFIKSIFPIILKEIPDIRFIVAGSEPPKEIKDLASEKIIITGYIPINEIDEYFLSNL